MTRITSPAPALARRLAYGLATLVVALWASASTAHAGFYHVYLCTDGSANSAWAPYSQDSHYNVGILCQAGGGAAFVNTPGYSVGAAKEAGLNATAPGATYIGGFNLTFADFGANQPESGGFQLVLDTVETNGSYARLFTCGDQTSGGIEPCRYYTTPNGGEYGIDWYDAPDAVSWRNLNFALYCADSKGCGGDVDERIMNATLNMVDTSVPAGAGAGGSLFTPGWHHAAASGWIGAHSAGSGIANVTETLTDAHGNALSPTQEDNPGCDYTQMRPCPDTTGDFEAAGVPDGTGDVLTVTATDAAGDTSVIYRDPNYDVDSTPPTATLGGAPDPDAWQRSPVTMTLAGSDQLSGMAASTDGNVEDGGYVTYQVDGGTPQRTAGASATFTVAGDGVHTITYSATDVAGNQSAPQTRVVRIDTSPPQATFAPQQPEDRLGLTVVAADGLSGVDGTDSVIQESPAGTDDWTSLATSADGDVLHAEATDCADGAVEFRALVYDKAGNERDASTRDDGSAMVLPCPLRVQTRLIASTAPPSSTRSCHNVRRRHPPGRTRSAATVRICTGGVPAALLRPVRVADGRSQRVFALLTDVAGQPLRDQPVAVVQQTSDATSRTQVAEAVTNSDGELGYTAPAGPSRTLTFGYAGTNLLGPSDATATLLVPASSTPALVTPREVLLSQPFVVTGRLRGGHVPPGGVLITLEGRDNGLWATLPGGVIKTDGRGRWRLRTSITAGLGVYTYPLRIVVVRQFGYPFEPAATYGGAITVIGAP